MYIHVYIYIHIYTYVYIYVYICLRTYTQHDSRTFCCVHAGSRCKQTQHTAIHYNTAQHSNTLQHTATNCNKHMQTYSMIAGDLVARMLDRDPSKRISAEKALLHPYVTYVCMYTCMYVYDKYIYIYIYTYIYIYIYIYI